MKKNKEALEYHSRKREGKLEVIATKPCNTERDLSLAYSPGVAEPCLEIAKDIKKVYDYTVKGNLVAVISNGSAVLGLGNIGPEASKPVMEGKGVLFKKFADIDVFDIEINTKDPQEFIKTVKSLEPTFGGINLEDIKAPECFTIEQTLKKEMNIPVFHDDQHGTAIISGAALINALELSQKKIEDIHLVINGAGASAIACARLFKSLGAKNIVMCDSRGVIYRGRTDGMNIYKSEFATETKARTLADAMKDSDVFIGLSVSGAVTQKMIQSMNEKPIVFAMANPIPEIMPEEAKHVRPDVIMATGRSDFPNQVNNVLGFPFIFRGALDVRATSINEDMKLAAVHALAQLAQEDVPESVSRAYGGRLFQFGPDYIIPKPFDPRVLLRVAPTVAKAAMDSGVAQRDIKDFDAYKDKLESQLGASKEFIRSAINRVKKRVQSKQSHLPKIVIPEASNEKILKAMQIVVDEGIAQPILLGYEDVVRPRIQELQLENLIDLPILHPSRTENFQEYADILWKKRMRKGVSQSEAERLIRDPYYYAAMMVENGDADGLVSGASQNYADCVLPILQIIGTAKDSVASGLIIMIVKNWVLFFADVTINIDPTKEEIAKIAVHAAKVAKYFNIQPRIAMLSFSNFTGRFDTPQKMQAAADIVKKNYPDLIVDGEMQADTATNTNIVKEIFPFSNIKKRANILLFPNLDAGNIAYKLVQQLGKGEVLGPFLMGIAKPANVLQRSCSVTDIVNTITLTALEIEALKDRKKRRRV